MYKGIAASPGIVIGPAHVISGKTTVVKRQTIVISKVEGEITRLRTAVEKTRLDLIAIKEKVVHDIGTSEAEIFTAYIQLLSDPMFTGKAEELIRTQLINGEYALQTILQNYAEFSSRIADAYLKERSRDINSLVDKIIGNMEASSKKEVKVSSEKYIIIAKDLSPADTADMDKNNVLGFVTEMGGATSHTAIVARSMEIPAVVGIRDITTTTKDGDLVIIDGEKGIVVINPNPKILNLYKEERKKFILKLRMLKRLKKLDALTIDRHKIDLSANIEFPEEIGAVLENNAEGVGLFRTEFIFINKSNLPNEEEQFEAYKMIAQKMNPRPVTIRTLDIGGDKFLPYLKIAPEQNPFLGLRAIRLSMANLNIFKLQLRAILRASAFGKIKIMFPMITIPEEVDEAVKIMDEVKAELKRKEVKFDEKIKIGAMIEVPSAVIMADEIAKRVDFFSIGTNDLIQYTVAADRGNESVSYLYDPLNPAVLRLIKMTANSAHKAGIKVSVCGEMAGAPHLAYLLIGLGIDELSVSPSSILSVKKLIRNISFKDALEAAEEALREEKPSVIRDKVLENLNRVLLPKKKEEENEG
jgi:phosphoenolpyruvate-protein phosphotransferase (PTS system enzyme I)